MGWAASVNRLKRVKEGSEPVTNTSSEPFTSDTLAFESGFHQPKLCDFGLVAASFHEEQIRKMTVSAYSFIVMVTRGEFSTQ